MIDLLLLNGRDCCSLIWEGDGVVFTNDNDLCSIIWQLIMATRPHCSPIYISSQTYYSIHWLDTGHTMAGHTMYSPHPYSPHPSAEGYLYTARLWLWHGLRLWNLPDHLLSTVLWHLAENLWFPYQFPYQSHVCVFFMQVTQQELQTDSDWLVRKVSWKESRAWEVP